MKTLILQIDIAQGTQWAPKPSINPIRKIFIPSVRRYAQAHSYDYQLVTESQYRKGYGDFGFLATKVKHFSFERYFHLKQDYDHIVYIDNDIYVFDKASPLPPIKGLMNAPEPKGEASEIFRRFHQPQYKKLPKHIKRDVLGGCQYLNSGVTMMDRKTAHHLQDYMLNRMRKKIRAKGPKNSDNVLLNEYILQYADSFTMLPQEWNYMPFLPNASKLTGPNFFHFVGNPGKKYLRDLLSKSPDIEDTLEKTWGGAK